MSNGLNITVAIDAVIHENCDIDALEQKLFEWFVNDEDGVFPELQVIAGVDIEVHR
jgi:hypothetical protein